MLDMSPECHESLLRDREDRAHIRNLSLDATPEQRRRYNLGLQLQHPQQADVADLVRAITEQNDVSPTRRRLIGIDGDYKSGKSHIASNLAINLIEDGWARHGRQCTADGVTSLVQTAFYANAAASGEADFMRSICESLRLPAGGSRDTAVQLMSRAKAQCRRSLTTHAFIDDVNMLATSRRGELLTQFLKRFLNEMPVTVIVIGSGLLNSPVFSPSTFTKADADAAKQLSTRLSLVELRPMPRPDADHDSDQWLHLVTRSACGFLLRKPFDPHSLRVEDYRWLWDVTAGEPAGVFELMTIAAASAVGGAETITGKGLRTAHRSLRVQPAVTS